MNEVEYVEHKRRRRKRVIAWVAVVLVLLLLLTWVFGLGSRNLKPTISYDFMADLNAPAEAVPVDQHGWPYLRDGVLTLRTAAHKRFLPGDPFDPSDVRLLYLVGAVGQDLHPVDSEVSASDEYTPSQLDNIIGGRSLPEDVPLTPSSVRAFFLEQQSTLESMRAACALPVLAAPYNFAEVLPEDPADQVFYYSPSALKIMAQEPPDTSLYGRSVFNVLIPHLSALRHMSRLFSADAQLAVEAGDGTRATGDFIAMLELARIAKQDSLVITQLMSRAIRSSALQLIQKILTNHSELFSREDLAQIAAVLVGPAGVMEPLSLAGEDVYFRDFIQRMYSDDGSGDGVLLIDSLREGGDIAGMDSFVQMIPAVVYPFARPILRSMTLTRKEVLTLHEQREELFDRTVREKPWELDFSAFHQAHAKFMPSKKPGPLYQIRYFPFTTLAIRYEGMLRNNFDLAARADRVRLIVALVRYERDHGAWPESLTQLVPDYLAEVLLDPADGAPLRYDVREGRPLLWSIGHDRIDNDGRSPVEFAGEVEDVSIMFDQDEAAQVKFGDLSPAPALVTGDDWILWRGPRAP